jgi:cytoskeletal protein CcmA (bactofilin family)
MFKSDNKSKNVQDIETIIGPSVKLEGDFEGSGDMVIDGIVIGSIKTKNFLKVGTEAKIKANIDAQNAFISGEVSGNISVKGNLELTTSAKINGDVFCHSLAVEKGALLNGKVSMNAQLVSKDSSKPIAIS